MDDRVGRPELDAAMAALEAQRVTLGDPVIDLALAPLRDRLASLEQSEVRGGTPKLKQVSILFVDLVGSTAIANRLDPEDVHELMDGILRRLTTVAEIHRGRVFNYTGDGLLAAFGADEAREDDTELAVRAGLAIIDEARWMGAELVERFRIDGLDVRVGIDTGAVVLGGDVEGARTIRGNAVNVAARMEQSAPVGGMRISHDTYRLVRGLFDVTEEPPISVKGIPAPVRTYLVHGAKPRAFRVTTRGIEGLETDMVGRAEELARLQRSFLLLNARATLQLITIVAEPGLGKSRLLYEFENWAEVQPSSFVIFKGRAQPHTRQQPYGLLRDLFGWRFQIADNDTADVARQRFVDALRPLFAEGDESPIHLLGHVIGLDFSASVHVRGIVGDPQQIRTRALAGAAQVFRRMALEGVPIVALFEDLHWADDDTLDFLTYLARSHPELPMLIIGSTRPLLLERRPTWIDDTAPNARIDLAPLAPDQAIALTNSLLQHLDEIPASLREVLTGRADGNPFFMEEILKMLLDEGALVMTEQGTWEVVHHRLATVQVPSTLMGVLQARLDALAADERTALQQASVIGFVFWDHALAALDERSPRLLAPLSRRGFVNLQIATSIVDAREFTFQHHLLQQFTYDSVLKRERRQYHARAAAWLAELAAQRGPEFLGATGEHYDLAGEPTKALDYYTRAAESATGRGARPAALEYVARALALTGSDDHVNRWRLLVARESILAHGNDPAAHDADLTALAAAAELLDDDAKRAEVALLRATALMLRAEHGAGETEARRALELSELAGTTRFAALAYAQLAIWGRRTNHFGQAREFAELGLALGRRSGDRRVEAALLISLASVVGEQGDCVTQLSLYTEALQIARETGDRAREASGLNNLGVGHFSQGRFDQAREAWESGLALSRQLEWVYNESIVLLNLAGLGTATGTYAEAIDHATAAVKLAVASASRDLEAAATLHLGVAHSRLGHHAAARAALTRSHELFILNDSPHYALDPIAALAVLDLAEGDNESAMARVEGVLDFVASGGELTAIEEPFRVRLECFTVLDHCGDPRAIEILEESRATLFKQAAYLPDGPSREQFLHANPYQRALLDAWSARAP